MFSFSVSNSRSNTEIINTGSGSRSTVEMIDSVTSSGSKVEFQIVDFSTKLDKTWRVASIKDVQAHMDDVKELLELHEWAICALSDGCVKGPGYNFEIGRNPGQKFGQKIIIRGKGTSFSLLF